MEQRPADIQLWANQEGTWTITQQSPRGFACMKEVYGVVQFKVHDSEIAKVHLFCIACDLKMSISADIVLLTMTDTDGHPIIDPKLPK